jgi:hypothetical protein
VKRGDFMENQAGSSQPTGKKVPRVAALPVSPALPLALLFVLCASLFHTGFVHAQGDVLAADTLAGYNLVADANVGSSAIAPTLPPAAQQLSETGEDPLATEAAPWWVIVVALTVLVIGLGTRTKPDR